MRRRLPLSPLLPIALLAAGALAQTAPDPVQFHPATYVVPPAVLDGDLGDTRCPDPTQPCLKDTDDLLGRTHVLRSDDLVLITNTPGASSANLIPAKTAASVVTAQTARSVTSPAPVVVGARMFDSATDVAVTVGYQSDASLLWRLDDLSGELASGSMAFSPGTSMTELHALATDLTGDHLDELVIWARLDVGGFGAVLARVATAVDTSNPASGLRFGDALEDFAPAGPWAIAAVTVAGQPRLMAAGPTTSSCGLVLNAYTVDTTSLALTAAGSWNPLPGADAGGCMSNIGLAAGHLGSATHDQLALLYAQSNGTIKVLPLDLDASGTPVAKAVFDTTLPIGGGNAQIASAPFDWSGALEQVALLVSNCFGCAGINTLRILSFDNNLNITAGSSMNANADQICDGQMVVGNFDRQQANPNAPPATFADPNLQIAEPFGNCTSGANTTWLRVFNVDPTNNFTVSYVDELAVSGMPVSLAALDLQGRSLRVGAPYIVTVAGRQQATLVLAAPPMHVDALVPMTGGAQRPFNISAVPDGFFAGYSFSSSTDTKTDTTNTTSWSFSAKETLEEKITAGDCDVGDCQNLGFKASAQQALKHSTATLTGSFSTTTSDLNVQTGLSDLVSTLSETLTIFVYPVTGRTWCPSTIPNCTEDQKVQMTVNLAGPDTVKHVEAANGADQTWYQPVWMPGHLLSYPGNDDQLKKAAFADPTAFSELSEPDAWMVGGGGTASKHISWAGGGSSGSTTSFKQNYSFDLDLSGGAQIGLGGVFTAEAQASLDLSGSVGFANLTNTMRTLSATQGIQLARTSPFLPDFNYDYQITPHIFGKVQPPTVVDANTVPADVQTFGALRTGYEVDPSGGFWWNWYHQAPDLALNHPARWAVSSVGSDAGDGTCLAIGASTSDYDCVVLGDRLNPNVSDPMWLSEFHWMRGLFITGPNGGGPQYGSANSGDQLLIQARVYNLSMASLAPTDRVYVRLMAMPWDTGNNAPLAGSQSFPVFCDKSVTPPICDKVLTGDQLPAFNTTTDNPNWTLVGQPFDTSGTNCGGKACDNLDLVFWAVVWAEDAAGNLLTELPQHGLASAPVAGADFLQVAGLEQPHGNNLGFYNQVFHIFPKPATATAALPVGTQSAEPLPDGVGAMITMAGSSARNVHRGKTLALALKLDTGPSDLTGGLEAVFHDGDPNDGAPVIGRQRLPFLSANTRYDFRVLYRPKTCGRRVVQAVVGEGTRHAHSVELEPIDVLCDDLAKLSGKLTAKSGTQGARRWTIAIANTGASTARGAVIDGLTLTQTGGAACSPLVGSAFPLALGDIPRGQSRSGEVTVNFAGCAPTARFRVQIDFSSDQGVVPGMLTLNNQFR